MCILTREHGSATLAEFIGITDAKRSILSLQLKPEPIQSSLPAPEDIFRVHMLQPVFILKLIVCCVTKSDGIVSVMKIIGGDYLLLIRFLSARWIPAIPILLWSMVLTLTINFMESVSDLNARIFARCHPFPLLQELRRQQLIYWVHAALGISILSMVRPAFYREVILFLEAESLSPM